MSLFITYGWDGGLLGEFNDARVEFLANQAITATPQIANTAHRYPTALLDLITAQLAIVNATQPTATGGTAQLATAEQDEALRLMEAVTSRVRFYYCSASDDREKTPELARIGFQPKRDPNAAQAQPLPDPPGPTTFNAATQSLALESLPAHATSLRAYRQAARGQPELAGESDTTTVSVTQSSPLTPGVTYDLWLVGLNSRGEGPESNHVTHVAT